MGYHVNLAPFEKAEAEERRRRATTPAALREVLEKRVTQVNDRVRDTVALHAALSDSDEKAELLKRIPPGHAEEIARGAASGLNLLEMSTGADPYVQPMLAYYGCEHLLGAVSRAILRWRGDARSHGLTAVYGARLEDTEVAIAERGFFRRLANAFAIFGGSHVGGGYNVFSARDAHGAPVALWSDSPIHSNASNGTHGPRLALPLRNRVRFDELVTGDPARIAGTAADLTSDPLFDPSASYILADVLIVFIAGSVCRYRPRLWRLVLDGIDSGIRVHVDAALLRVATALADGATSMLLSGVGPAASNSNLYRRLPQVAWQKC